jgi:hypothetical protein
MENTEIKKNCVNRKTIIQAVEAWGISKIVWLTIFSLLGEKHKVYTELNSKRINHNHQRFNLSLHSSCGAGKSFNTVVLTRFLQKFVDMPFAKEICGRYTAKALVKEIMSMPHGTFFVDESEAVFNDVDARSVLRQMTYGTGVIAWKTARETENMEIARFSGNIITSMNNKVNERGQILDVSNEHLKANFDRALVLSIRPTIADAVITRQKQYETKTDEASWKWIAEKILELRNNPKEVILTEEETQLVMDFWKEEIEKSEQDNISLRSYDKTVQIFGRMKIFLGLDEDTTRICKYLSRNVIRSKVGGDMVKEVLNNEGLTRADLAQKIAEERNISLRQSQRIIKRAIEEGKIKELNQIITP